MLQRRFLRFVCTDLFFGRARRNIIVVFLTLGLFNFTGLRVDFVLIFIPVGIEFDFVTERAVVFLQLAFRKLDVAHLQAGMLQRRLARSGFSDIKRCTLPAYHTVRIAVRKLPLFLILALGLPNRAGQRLDVILVLISVRIELDLVNHHAVFTVKPALIERDFFSVEAGVLKRGFFCFFLTDIFLVARRTDKFHLIEMKPAGFADQIQLVDRKGNQFLKRIAGIMLGNLKDQLCLAESDAVLVGELFQFFVFADRLAEHRPAEGIRLQQTADFLCQLFAQSGALIRVAVVDTDQNGVCGFADIAAAQHRSHQRVDRHFQIAALEIHVADNGFSVLVEGDQPKYAFVLVDFNFYTGVYIQRHRGSDAVIRAVRAHAHGSAQQQHNGRRCAHQPLGPAIRSFSLCHGNHLSSLFFTVGKHGRKHIGSGLVKS